MLQGNLLKYLNTNKVWQQLTNHYGLIVVIVTFGLMMGWLSVARYWGYNLQSFDLGNMGQAIWSGTQGQPLVFTTEGIAWSRLAFHVEIIYLLLVPLYAVWPSPVSLLLVQAVVYALGAAPLYRLALRRLEHKPAALLLAIVYLLYPVAQTAVLFQFHGDTLAMPFLIFAIDAFDRKAWRVYGVWLMLALSCKFYVAAPVAALGAVAWWQGQRRAGIFSIVLALVWGAVAFLVIRPFFAPDETVQAAATTGGYLSYYFSQLGEIGPTLPARLANGLIVIAPVLLLVWRAPLWLLPVAAVVLPTLISNGPGPTYDYRYHHYALAVPFLLAAAVYGAERMQQVEQFANNRSLWLGRIRLTFDLALVLSMLLVNTPLSPFFYFAGPGSGRGLDGSGYGRIPRDDFKDQWLAENVPAGAPLMADDQLGTRLFNRSVYYRLQPQFRAPEELFPRVDYVVIDSLNDFNLGHSRMTAEYDTIARLLQQPEWQLLRADDGLLLFGRKGNGLTQAVVQLPLFFSSDYQAIFADQIALVQTDILPLGGNRFQLIFPWLALSLQIEDAGLTAVSRISNIPHLRFVHLPTATLMPVATWPEDQLIQETIDIVLPPDMPSGRYPIWTGWYDSNSLFAAETDARSRIGDEVQIGWLDIP